ncbi:MAG: orange carotenoid protein N-terminal domain-containing protein [Leptolyngbyaceae cyanobacterium]
MTTYSDAVNNTDSAIQTFQELTVDEQLAWLWFIYKKMGSSITPAAPGAAASNIAEGLFNQVKGQSQEAQLESMRAIARQDSDNLISREYGSLSSDTKLAFWYALAIGMDQGSIIGMPDDYALGEKGKELLAAAESSDFETQITLLRNAVDPMGAAPEAGSAV